MSKNINNIILMVLMIITTIACDQQVFVIQDKAAEDCHKQYGKDSKKAKQCVQGTYYAKKNLVQLLCRDDVKSCLKTAYFQCGEHNFHKINHNNPCIKGIDFFMKHGSAAISSNTLDQMNRRSRSIIGENAIRDNIRSSKQRNYSQKLNFDIQPEEESRSNSISV